MTRAILTLAALTSMSAAPVSGMTFDERLASIRLAGSERMMVHTLSQYGLPQEARDARDQILGNMGMTGGAGVVSKDISFMPIVSYDPNINGGFASSSFQAGGYEFTVADGYKAAAGLVLGGSVNGAMRIALGGRTSLDLTGGATFVYSPKHDMSKLAVGAQACLNTMFSTSTYGFACVDAVHQKLELGKQSRIGAKIGVNHVFSSRYGTHELSFNLQHNRHFESADYSQKIVSGTLTSAINGPLVLTAGFQLGEKVDGPMLMRKKAFIRAGFEMMGAQNFVTVSVQKNAGGRFLGEALVNKITTVEFGRMVGKKTMVSLGVSKTKSSADFFSGTEVRLSASMRF